MYIKRKEFFKKQLLSRFSSNIYIIIYLQKYIKGFIVRKNFKKIN